jgi:hypothetical protein
MFMALQEQGGGQVLRNGWATVLSIPEADVQYGEFGLPLVARVLSRAVEEAERADAEVGVLLRRDFIDEWRKPVFTPGGNLAAAVQQQQVGQEALAYLATIASVLQRRDGAQTLPEGDELAGLLDQVDDFASSVEASADVPEEVKLVLLRKINQVRFAIENVRIGGNEGVHEAVEALVGAVVVRESAIPNWMRGKIAAFLVAFYAVFTAGPAMQASIESWHDMGGPVIEAVGEAIDDDDAERPEPLQPPDDEQASAEHER